jgi:PKD repeat protein/spore coat protein CotH
MRTVSIPRAHRSRRAATALIAMLVFAATVQIARVQHANADPGGVVISELGYHSVSDLDTDDFLELANTSSSPIDMSGWSFTAGVNETFPAGTTIAGNGRFVVASNATSFKTLYGFLPDATYTGKLSNSGEAVTLVDASMNVIDTVTYSDSAPWPTSPDGGGPTLELRDLLSDNTDPANWGASLVTGGTPDAVNSIEGPGAPPVVGAVTATPASPAPSQSVQISAALKIGSTATLTYKVMFGADVVVPFLDDAASPGGAGDGVYAASIPGQAAGQLVRYRIDATSGTTTYSDPVAGDTVNYRGYVVNDPSVSSALPVIQWFMDDSVYNDLLANHRQDDVQGAAVWAYNGQVTDNVLMSIRGGNSRNDAKVQWKVDMPKGYDFDLGGKLPYPEDEFALQNYSENNADLAWATVGAAGDRSLAIIPVRTQRNGTFWSLGRIMETEDGNWRKAQGVDDWAIYKGDAGAVGKSASPATLAASGWLEKRTRTDEDFTDVWTLGNTVDAAASAAQEAWIYQNVNIPELVNYMAINSLIRNEDSGWHNWWLARDTDGTGRWEMWQWDLDLTFGTAATDNKGLFLTPDTQNNFTTAMLAYPDIKEMFYRRLRTLADEFLTPGQYEAEWDAISAQTTPDWLLDNAKWGGATPSSARSSFLRGLADRRNAINNNTGPGKLVPTSQSPDATAVISEIQYNPAGTGGEFLELSNPSSTAVDISGWTIDAVNLTIQPGTVIPAGGSIVFVSDDKDFRAAYPTGNRLVGGQYTGKLDNSGEAVVLQDGSRVVDSVTYSPDAPWPTAANGTGPSLELTSLSADNSDPANWTATSTVGGTPGMPNTGTVPPITPTAKFTSSSSGLTLTANGSGSSAPGDTIASYAWTFGDGETGTGVSPNHVYASAGTYTVGLTVTDTTGGINTVSQSVLVGATSIAQDAFGRTSTNGLGTADQGGAWTTVSTASNYAVNGGVGKVTTPAGGTRYAYLAGVSSNDTDLTATATFARPTTGNVYVGLIGRRVGSLDYRERAVVSPSGAVSLQLQQTATTLASGSVAGLTFASADTLQLRLQVVGTSPTTLRAKVWKVGSPEPAAWQFTATSSTSGLQVAGSVGLTTYLSSGAAPSSVVVSYDNLIATHTTVTPPPPAGPTAAFTSSTSGLTASVDASGSTDTTGTITSYVWSFGDGGSATGVMASNIYAAANTYSVTLTVMDNNGLSSSVSHNVTVSAATTGTTFAQDSFGRTVVNGFGTADTGGAWTTVSTASNYAVNGGLGKMTAAAGATRDAYLAAVSSSNTDLTATATFTRPTAGSVYVGLLGRRVGSADYEARVVVSSAGAVELELRQTSTTLTSETVPGLTFASGNALQVRVQVVGTSPTTVRAKVWKVGSAEPAAWQLTTTSSTAGLQAAGSIGLSSYFANSGKPTPIVVSFGSLVGKPS